jgi:hypothetical protein
VSTSVATPLLSRASRTPSALFTSVSQSGPRTDTWIGAPFEEPMPCCDGSWIDTRAPAITNCLRSVAENSWAVTLRSFGSTRFTVRLAEPGLTFAITLSTSGCS